MKLFAPDYYENFACIKGDCRHSCCIGWEIDIDEDSLSLYQTLPGETGEKLRRCIDCNGDCAHFILAEQERCPFLNAEGLCELILAYGEGALCQICDDHPRFRNFFSDREEIGLGLCCEAAARLILGCKHPVKLRLLEDDGDGEENDTEESALIELRERLIGVMQNRELPVWERVTQLAREAGIPLDCCQPHEWTEFLRSLEHLDDAWPRLLGDLQRTERMPVGFDEALEQLMVYLLFWHLPGALDDGDCTGRLGYCLLIWRLIAQLFAQGEKQDMDALAELCRMYSSELEYSDENIAAILRELHRRYPGL